VEDKKRREFSYNGRDIFRRVVIGDLV
jgi:hypothetical protein